MIGVREGGMKKEGRRDEEVREGGVKKEGRRDEEGKRMIEGRRTCSDQLLGSS